MFDLSLVFSQGVFPARFKELHYYNLGAFYDWMMGLIRLFLKKKFKDRVNSIVFACTPLPPECKTDVLLVTPLPGSLSYVFVQISS